AADGEAESREEGPVDADGEPESSGSDDEEEAESGDDSTEREASAESESEAEAETVASDTSEAEEESAEDEAEEEATDEESTDEETPPRLADIEILKVRLSDEGEPVSLADVIPEGEEEPIGEQVARALTLSLQFIREGKVSLDDDAPAEAEVGAMWGAISEEFPGISVTDDDASAPAGIQIDTGDEDESSNGATIARTRVRKEKPIWGELIKIVLGGIVGLVIGYYLINFLFGARCDFLKVPLPGVPHTYSHAPEWWPDWLKWGAPKESGHRGDLFGESRIET
ncbi:MAG: hypothetical protein D6741_09825, partial [Planctomycetota bacterium]